MDYPTVLHRVVRERPILVVEDDALQGLHIADMLRDAGACVIGPVCSAEEGINLVRADACVAAVIDFRLQQFNAVPLGHELHARQIPFVIHTAFDCVGVLPLHWRGYRVVTKPASPRELLRTVSALLRWRSWTRRER